MKKENNEKIIFDENRHTEFASAAAAALASFMYTVHMKRE